MDIKIIKVSKDKGTVIFTLNNRTLCEHIHFFDSQESQETNLFEPIDLGGDWEHEREGFEYSADSKYPSYEELHEGQIIELLEWMHKNHQDHGFATLSDMIDEQFVTYNEEVERLGAVKKAMQEFDKLQKLIAA